MIFPVCNFEINLRRLKIVFGTLQPGDSSIHLMHFDKLKSAGP